MPSIVNLLLLVVGVIVTGVGFAGLRGKQAFLAVMPIGVGLIGLAYIGDMRREKRAEEIRRTDVGRIKETKRMTSNAE